MIDIVPGKPSRPGASRQGERRAQTPRPATIPSPIPVRPGASRPPPGRSAADPGPPPGRAGEAAARSDEPAAEDRRRSPSPAAAPAGDPHPPRAPAPSDLPIDERRLGVLRQVARDGGTLEPRWAPLLATGYSYFDIAEPGAVAALFDDLAYLADRDYLRREHFDRLVQCGRCASHHINVREVCGVCRSSNIEGSALLHHFRCGYVGAVERFETTQGGRVCPKCDGRLQFLGTDHEVVGETFECRTCGASFDEPDVEGVCLSCGQKAPGDSLSFTPVHSFSITSLGRSALRSGRLFDLENEQLTEGALPLYRRSVFLGMARDELRKQQRYGIAFSLLVLSLTPSDPDTAVREEHQFVALVRDTLRLVDQLGRYDERTVLVSLPATDAAGAQIVLDRLLALRPPGSGLTVDGAVVATAAPDQVEQAVMTALAQRGRQ